MSDESLARALLSRPAETARLATPERFAGATIAVTGAGGSIGSEICRRLAPLRPSLLLLIGHGERSLLDIAHELAETHRFTNFRIVLADVGDTEMIDDTFARYRPDMVIHAAAHKHVPIVEENVAEAARTNVLGAHAVAQSAARWNVSDALLLSTDKAVRPASVLGWTKLAAETIWRADRPGSGRFIAIRFGNVLGSRGGVLEVFRRQLERGLPLTVTDRRMRRFFVTVGEAASSALRAIEQSAHHRLFVLDSGNEVEIAQLAARFLAAYGAVGHPIVETGMRAGEKLSEELLTEEERSRSVRSGNLLIVDHPAWSGDLTFEASALSAAISSHDDGKIVSSIKRFAVTGSSSAEKTAI